MNAKDFKRSRSLSKMLYTARETTIMVRLLCFVSVLAVLVALVGGVMIGVSWGRKTCYPDITDNAHGGVTIDTCNGGLEITTPIEVEDIMFY